MQEALKILEEKSSQESKDRLVFMLEYGTALHIAGRYDESNKIFLAADKLSEQLDYHSVSKIAVATLSGEENLQYKGESYERLLINCYLALNFLMLGQFDSAMVEVRRIDQKINKFRSDGRQDYELNPFAKYLAGIIWEADQKYDDAYISFHKSHEIDGSNPLLPEDLIRSSKLARRNEAYESWRKAFPTISEDSDWYDKKQGQLILVFQQGWGPRKDFSMDDHRFPRLVPQRSDTQAARIQVFDSNGSEPLKTAVTRTVYNVEGIAMKTLQADYSWMMLRKIGAFAAKEVVADQIRQKDKTLGFIAQIIMHVSDRADLRHWATLPQTVQLARVSLPPGEYRVTVRGVSDFSANHLTPDLLELEKIKIRPGKKTFLSWRALH